MIQPVKLSDCSVPEDAPISHDPSCVVRKQEAQYLIYNSKTDKLHLISPTGYLVYSLCDGSHTKREIFEALVPRFPDNPAIVRDQIFGFIDMLFERHVLRTEL